MWNYVYAAIALYVGWSFIALQINYKRASSMGIPLVRIPVDGLNVPWQVLESHFFGILDCITSRTLPSYIRYMRRGWFWFDKAESHLRYGPVWAIVTPRNIWVQVGHPEAVHNVLAKRQDFIRPYKNYQPLDLYGPNVFTVDATQWSRHRKLIAAPFNESVMKLVWTESTRQTKQMVAAWTEVEGLRESNASVTKDTRTVSLNVLAATGFRKPSDFQSRSTDKKATDDQTTFSYRDALCTILDNIILLLILPSRWLCLPCFPQSFNAIGRAAVDFRSHMERMLQEEETAIRNGEPGSGGLMTSFVRALESNEISFNSSKKTRGLSVDEIIGNLFVINFAGHDTTANTLAFAIYLLAMAPEVQDWLAEELHHSAQSETDWEYERAFPRMVRCRAVLYETLRMYPPALALPKHTPSSPQALQVGDREILIPAHVHVQPSLLAIHMHPRYWPDPGTWNPRRWIARTPRVDAGYEETLISPVRGTYFPWSDGPQNCPGRKFSEVEFTAVIACLMKLTQLNVIRNEGESELQARERVKRVVNECDNQMLLKMRDPERVKLSCERRA